MQAASTSTHLGRRPQPAPRAGPRTRQHAVEAQQHEERLRNAQRQQRSRAWRSAVAPDAIPNVVSLEEDGAPRPRNRSSFRTTVKRHADRISATLLELLEDVDCRRLRAAILKRVFRYEHVRSLLPDDYPSPEDVTVQQQILRNIRAELDRMKIPNSNGKLARKRSILEAVVSEADADISSFHHILGTRKSNLVGAAEHLRNASSSSDDRLLVPRRRKREGGIPDAVKCAVANWWTEETRVSPNRKDIRRKRLGRNVYDTHAAHLLLETQKALYNRFVVAHPECVIMLRSFIYLRSYFVIKCKERNVCCCRYHVQVLFLLEALNAFRHPRTGAHFLLHCNCECIVCGDTNGGVCRARDNRFVGVTALWESVLCPKSDDSEFHALECLMGTCSRCGVNTFQLCPREMTDVPGLTIKWKQFQYEVVGSSADGKPKKRITEVVRATTFSEFFEFFKPTIKRFIWHNFEARWQTEQAKLLRSCLQEGTILSHIDFAENYTFQVQNEIQSMYYSSTQITILVQVTYYIASVQVDGKVQPSLTRETHYYISDDRSHDTFFVQHCLQQHWQWFSSNHFSPRTHFIFSDGCSSQFKGARALYFAARYPSITGGCKMVWNFFGSGHGKGEWDGAGAVVKRKLRSEQLLNPNRTLQTAADCVTFLNAALGGQVPNGRDGLRSYRFFHHVGIGDVARSNPHACDPIPGSSAFHSVFATDEQDPTKLFVRELSCFCGPCLEDNFMHCENQAYVKPWKVLKIEPRRLTSSRAQDVPDDEDDAWDWDYTGEGMVDLVQPGDNFAVPAVPDNEEGVSFYILQCQTPKTVVRESFDCTWGGHFEAGEHVISATYYQKWGRQDLQNYVYLANSQPAHVDANIVLACKFQMIPREHRVKGGQRVYTLAKETVDVIHSALDCL